MPLHPAWVKNISRRVLWAALEKDITKADRAAMESFFGKQCAYCGSALEARWHADHLVNVDGGGYNHLSNRVPACPSCNEKEKREMPWLGFLERKCNGDAKLLKTRRGRIEEWVNNSRFKEPPVTEAQRRAWEKEIADLAVAIDAAWIRLKNTKAD